MSGITPVKSGFAVPAAALPQKYVVVRFSAATEKTFQKLVDTHLAAMVKAVDPGWWGKIRGKKPDVTVFNTQKAALFKLLKDKGQTNQFRWRISQDLFAGKNLDGIDLSDLWMTAPGDWTASFSKSSLKNANFARTRLYRPDFSESILTGANFSEASLRESRWKNANCEKANFSKADLPESQFQKTRCQQANFSDAKLYRMQFIFSYADRANFQGADLLNANLNYSVIRQADFRNAKLYGKEASARASQWEGSDLRNANLMNADFSQAYMQGTDLTGGTLYNTKFHRARMGEAKLSKTALEGADFTQAKLRGTVLDFHKPFKAMSEEVLRKAGFEVIPSGWVIGYRSQESYETGKTYKAPWFSTCSDTENHPGLTIHPSIEAARDLHQKDKIIRVACALTDVLKAGHRYRTPVFEVLNIVESKS